MFIILLLVYITYWKLGLFKMSNIIEENMEQDIILSSSPILHPQSEMDTFLQNRAAQNEIKQGKISKIEQARSLIFDIIEMEDNGQIKKDLNDGITMLNFLITKIKNPSILSPKETLLNEINSKIYELSSKFDNLENNNNNNQKNKNNNNNNNNKNNEHVISKENYNYPPSPRVVIPLFKPLEESIHRNNEFQEVQYKKKNQNNIKNNSNNISQQATTQNIEKQPIQQLSKNEFRPSSEDTETRNQLKAKYKEKRLILQVPEEFVKNLAPFTIRNEINRAFQNNNIKKPVIASITKSKSNLSIILITMDDFSAKFLIETKAIWETYIPFTNYQYDEEWIKLIAHKVPTKPFQCEEGPNMLKEDIESFNNIKLIRTPIWLSQEETRLQKNHSSIIIHISDPQLADILIKRKIFIAGELCKIEKFIPKYIQCEKCQKYGHTKFKCKNDYKCRICAQNHDSSAHFCSSCHTKKQCYHMPIKCANCNLSHMANDHICLEWQKVNPKMRNIIPMDTN